MNVSLRRKGSVLIYTTLAMTVVTAVCALAVDLGRVQLAKTELRRMCDAAARSAVTGISNGTSLAKANWIGSQNTTDTTAHTFAAGDVEPGVWDLTTQTFTPTVNSPNAVRVTARRTTANNNAIPTALARGIGINSIDVTVQSIAFVRMGGYGVVGLEWIYMSGNASSSYWSNGQGDETNHGSIASNGNIWLNGNSSIQGDARPGIGKTVFGASRVTGSTAPLTSPLAYPNGNAGSYAHTNDNSNVPTSYIQASSLRVGSNRTLPLPGGNYYFNNIEIKGTITFSGPATIYCYGSFHMEGRANTSSNLPGNLKIVMCPSPSGAAPGTLTIAGSADLYANIYAPQSAVTLSGQGGIYGTVLGKSVYMDGTSNIHYDLALDPENGTISLVR